MAKNIETMTSNELKNQILHTEIGDGGMGPDSPGGYPQEILEADEEDAADEQEAQEESQDEVEEISPVEYLEMRAQERLQTLSPSQKSAYHRAVKEAARQEEMEKANDFQEDALEFASKYSAFPDVVQRFSDDFRFNRIKLSPVEAEDFETVDSPQESLFFSWLNRQKIPSSTMKEILTTFHNGPKLKSRFRDRLAGYNKQPRKRMTDKEIKETVDTILEE